MADRAARAAPQRPPSGAAAPTDGEPPVLELIAVTKSYGERVVTEVLHGVDLIVQPGEFAALVGPSGSGKSTLLNLMGLLDRPTSGHVRVRGVETADLDDDELTAFRGRTIGFVFQFHHLLPAFTALENVALPGYADRGWPSDRLWERADELLRRVGLAPQRNNLATDLSGGQQQRVAIARALAMDPPLVLADEPTGNLDTETTDEVFELLRQCNRDCGSAFVVVTHDRRLAERCDRIIELVDGRIRSDQPLRGA